MAKRLRNLNNIIATLRSGAEFFRKSARQTDDETLGEIFVTHADIRERHAKTLADVIEGVGGEVVSTSPTEEAHALYGRLAGRIRNSDRPLVNALEEHEDRTIAVFRDALLHPDSERDHDLLMTMLADFNSTHDRMRDLKRQYATRSKGRTRRDTSPTLAAEHQPEHLRAAPPTPDDPRRADRRGKTGEGEGNHVAA